MLVLMLVVETLLKCFIFIMKGNRLLGFVGHFTACIIMRFLNSNSNIVNAFISNMTIARQLQCIFYSRFKSEN